MSLAYLTASTYGLAEEAARLQEVLDGAKLALPTPLEGATALLPPTPIVREENWPLLTVARSAFDPTLAGPAEGGTYCF